MEIKQSTRETILSIALDLFSLRGYESVGTQEIVDKSGITKPTLYHHFGSKRGLLDAIIADQGGKMHGIVERGTVYNHDLVMNLTLLTRELITFALTNQSFYRLHLALMSSAPETETYHAYLPLRTGINTLLETMFIEAAKDHGNMKGREKAYSETFQGMARTWSTLIVNRELELTDELLYKAVHQFMHGIFS